MPRPRKCRKVCRMPIADTFVANSAKEEAVVLTVDEYECIRLVDYQGFSQEQCAEYQKRRDVLCGGLRKIGWNVPDSKGTMFVWAPIPEKFSSSMEFWIRDTGRTASTHLPPRNAMPRIFWLWKSLASSASWKWLWAQICVPLKRRRTFLKKCLIFEV